MTEPPNVRFLFHVSKAYLAHLGEARNTCTQHGSGIRRAAAFKHYVASRRGLHRACEGRKHGQADTHTHYHYHYYYYYYYSPCYYD